MEKESRILKQIEMLEVEVAGVHDKLNSLGEELRPVLNPSEPPAQGTSAQPATSGEPSPVVARLAALIETTQAAKERIAVFSRRLEV